MRHRRVLTLVALAGTALLATSCGRERTATIVVDIGAYATAAAAGHDEAHVDWSDRGSRQASICTASFAACELQRYLRAATRDSGGFRIADDDSLPAGDVILIGGPGANLATTRFASGERLEPGELTVSGPEGYVIRTFRQGGRRVVVIAGGGRVGTLYGVYDFLQRVGVRWLAPGRANEEVPSRPWSRVPDAKVRETPHFTTRGFHAWEDRGDPEFFVWMARNRLNYWCVEEQERPLLHKLGITLSAGGHALTMRYLDPRAAYPFAHERFGPAPELPPDPYPVSAEFRGDADGDGRLSYFEAHPEWYGLQRGQRSSRIEGDQGDNFCTSNDQALAEFTRKAVDDLADGDYRDADVLNAWMLDQGKWCLCPRCKALGTPTDRTILVVDRLERAIDKARVEGRIRRPIQLYFLAYAETSAPPTRPLPADFDYAQCAATFFPIVRCYAHRMGDKACETNARYDARLRGWASAPDRHYRGHVAIGEYYNVSGYKSLPLCLMHVMQRDIPYYASLGIRDFDYMHVTTRHAGTTALTNWQMARQLWNPRVDCEALWDDWFASRYGAAGPSMRGAYERIEAMLANVSDLKYGLARRLRDGVEPLFVDDHLPRSRGRLSMDHALAAASEGREILDDVMGQALPERIRRRVVEDDRRFAYGERTLSLLDAVCRTTESMKRGDRTSAIRTMRDARVLANALRGDTTSTRSSSSHANARDALEASGVAHVVERLDSVLAAARAREYRTYDPRRAPLVLTSRDLDGGVVDSAGIGITVLRRVGWRFDGASTPRRVTPADPVFASFVLDAEPARDLHVTFTGFRSSVDLRATRAVVLANGHLAAGGDIPLSHARASAIDVAIPARFLVRGSNRIEIRDLDDGARGAFSVTRAEVGEAPASPAAKPFAVRGPLDVALTYTSAADSSEQRYRLFLPGAYDGATPLPVLVALHGTGGTENSYFDDTSYAGGRYTREAEAHGLMVVCPRGRGDTEYRGIGELDVLQVVDRVKRDLRVAPDRIVCSGFSMGGTGTSYLAMRHPDVFAGGIALSSSHEQVGMLENLRYVPMLYIQGQRDWPVYAREGPVPITARLRELGYKGDLWMLPGIKHNTTRTTTAALMDWALKRRGIREPRRVTFTTYFPHQGKAYWTEITDVTPRGALARLDARVEAGNRVTLTPVQARRIVVRPDSRVLDLTRPIVVDVGGARVFDGMCDSDSVIVCSLVGDRWRGERRPAALEPPTGFHWHPAGTVTSPPTQDGLDETTMGNWMTDMMRAVSGADVAIYNRRDYRGVRLRPGSTVYTEDLHDWIRPYDRPLCTFECTGRELLDILEANILDQPDDRSYLVQVSGCRYVFDRRRPAGHRITATDLQPSRTYTVACEGQVLSRETIRLAGRFGQITYGELEPTAVSAAWRYIGERGGEIGARLEGRVRDATPSLEVAASEE